jgi:hypothetical protein
MSEVDQKLSEVEAKIAVIERQAAELREAAHARPTAVSDEDVQLMDRLLASWHSLRASIARHPEFRERARDLALKRATGRARET